MEEKVVQEVGLGQEEEAGTLEWRKKRTEGKGARMEQEEEEMKEGPRWGRRGQEMEETRRRPQAAEDTRKGAS